MVLSDSMRLQLQGPHIHFNAHTLTQLYTQIHTHYLLPYFPISCLISTLWFLSLHLHSTPQGQRRICSTIFFPVHVCILRALYLLLLPSRFHLFSMLLILFVPTSPAPPPFLTFTPLTGVKTVFFSPGFQLNRWRKCEYVYTSTSNFLCAQTDKVWCGFLVHICSWSPVWASSTLWKHVGSQTSHTHTDALLIPNSEPSRACNQPCVCWR